MSSTARPTEEPIIALPVGRLLAAIIGAAAVTTLGWLAVVRVAGLDGGVTVAGVAGAALVVVTSAAIALAMRPWRSRPVGSWANLWLGALVARLLLTPALAYLLYSAAPLSGTPLLLSVATTYVIVQLSEAVVLALHIKSVT